MPHIYIDADACPVKPEVYRVAKRCELNVTLVANSFMRYPNEPWLTIEVVGSGADVADDWIAEHAQLDDIVITSDVPLASRCIEKGDRVIAPSGKVFTEDNIGSSVAVRDLLTGLREAGEVTGGPPPIKPADRSRFLQELDRTIQTIRRDQKRRSIRRI